MALPLRQVGVRKRTLEKMASQEEISHIKSLKYSSPSVRSEFRIVSGIIRMFDLYFHYDFQDFVELVSRKTFDVIGTIFEIASDVCKNGEVSTD